MNESQTTQDSETPCVWDQGGSATDASIVVGFDFSIASSAAFGVAFQLAQRLERNLRVLHVRVSGISQKLDPVARSNDDVLGSLRLECSTAAAALGVKGAGPVPTISYHVRKGIAQDELLSFCEEEGAGLLVIGSHNAVWLKRLLHGNRAKELLHQCSIPLLTVPPATELTARQILVAVDLTPSSQHAMRAAIRLAEVFEAALHVLHVGGGLLDKLSAGDEFQLRAQEQFSAFLAPFQEATPALELHSHLVFGDRSEQIVGLANEVGADLLVLGAAGRDGMKRLVFGNTAESIAPRVSCSLLTIRI